MGKKIRSIQVVNVRWFNATAWYALYLSRLLQDAGHKTLVLGLHGTKSFKKAKEWGLNPSSLPLNSTNPLALTHLYGDLNRIIGEFKPDIINCHRGEAFVLFALLKKVHNFALVRTRGDQRPPKNNLSNRWLHKNAADALIATNSATATAFTCGLGVPPDKVFTILGGVDTRRFYPDRPAGQELRAALGIHPDEFVLGILGRLDPVKGHETLISALGQVKQQYPQKKLRLLCIGEESNIKNNDLENMAREAGVLQEINITGRVDNVTAYLNALDLGVVASLASETIARAALEIIACDIPLISTNVGVMQDILPADALITPGNAALMATEITKCLDSPARLVQLRNYGAKALANLNPHDFLNNSLAVYEYAQEKNSFNPSLRV